MSVQPGTYKLGDEILYTITIANNGPRVATGINLADALPAGAQFIALDSSSGVSNSGGAASVFVGARAGDSVQAFISIRSTTAGNITSTANVTLAQTDSNPANNTFSLVTPILPGASVTVLSATPGCHRPRRQCQFLRHGLFAVRWPAHGNRHLPREHDRLGHQDARQQQPGKHQPVAAHARRSHDHSFLRR